MPRGCSKGKHIARDILNGANAATVETSSEDENDSDEGDDDEEMMVTQSESQLVPNSISESSLQDERSITPRLRPSIASKRKIISSIGQLKKTEKRRRSFFCSRKDG